MDESPVTDRILTIPNAISFVRLAMVPVFWWLVLSAEEIGIATVLLIVVSWTDWVDGYLARRLDQVTKLGKSLDPIADRLMIASAVLAGLISGIIPAWVGYPLLLREAYMALLTFGLVRRRQGTLEVRYLGKVATFLIYGAIQSFYIAAVPFARAIFLPLAWVSAAAGLVLYWITAIQYTGDARRVMREVESATQEEET